MKAELIDELRAEITALLAGEIAQGDIILEQAAEIARLEVMLAKVTPAIEALKKAVESQPNVQEALAGITKLPGKTYDDTKLMQAISDIAKKMDIPPILVLHRDSTNTVQEIIVRRPQPASLNTVN